MAAVTHLSVSQPPPPPPAIHTSRIYRVPDIPPPLSPTITRAGLRITRAGLRTFNINGRCQASFDPDDLQRLLQPTAWLNDVCLNGYARLLQNFLAKDPLAQDCSILSTFVLPKHRQKTTDDQLWNHVKRDRFWEHERWIIPIHRTHERHWLMCVVYSTRKQITFFDSFADKELWRRDVQVRFLLIALDLVFTSGSGCRGAHSQANRYRRSARSYFED
jgi:hypothetical protein